MANLQALAVEFGAAFPFGVGMVGEVQEQNDFNASTREHTVQARDKETGLPLWQVEVLDFDPQARDKTFKVKIAAAVQPVPPEQSGTVPVRPAVSVLRSGVAIGLVLRRRKPLSSDGWDGNRGRTPARSEEPNVVR